MFNIKAIGGRTICIGGVGKMFYQSGFPISMAIEMFNKKGIEVSMYHIIEEFWENGWSWKTIESKIANEINGKEYDFKQLKEFYQLLEQPKRGNGGYEQSRNIIFAHLFKNTNPENWLRQKLDT